jgi:hypothetical protein
VIDSEARFAQSAGDELRNRCVVFDQQRTHLSILASAGAGRAF